MEVEPAYDFIKLEEGEWAQVYNAIPLDPDREIPFDTDGLEYDWENDSLD